MSLLDVLESPATQVTMSVLVKTRPEIGIALELVVAILETIEEHHQMNLAIKAIDDMATAHIQQLTLTTISPAFRTEIEIRLHEVLTVLVKLGGMP